ncbi:hypothetical protein PENSPDRAFT_666874 [Peniophora sp. CONT]|nr:hypothetical protein PENSPDRAFT_666874 [Peniophora sp. CONT]
MPDITRFRRAEYCLWSSSSQLQAHPNVPAVIHNRTSRSGGCSDGVWAAFCYLVESRGPRSHLLLTIDLPWIDPFGGSRPLASFTPRRADATRVSPVIATLMGAANASVPLRSTGHNGTLIPMLAIFDIDEAPRKSERASSEQWKDPSERVV